MSPFRHVRPTLPLTCDINPSSRIFYVAYSLLLPQAGVTAALSLAAHQTLVLQSPGRAGPVPIPTLEHLNLFIREHLDGIRKEKSVTATEPQG